MPLASSRLLPPWARLLTLAVNLALGLAPSALYLLWVERNCALPRLPIELGWPWLSASEAPLLVRAAIDAGLIIAWGIIHTLTAQPRFARALDPRVARTVYVAIAGLSLVALMGLWQSTGVIVWHLPLQAETTIIISSVLFWSFIAAAASTLLRFNAWQFLGWKQAYSTSSQAGRPEGTSKLIENGLYAHVRHPIYAFTLAAFIVTPFLSLDRLIVFAASALYLVWAIPIEERKLAALFGRAYERYRARVPAVVPRLTRAG